jgi:carbonic anhydrase/acetyltransferase-like protein (isoleucine patch superfamily)
VSGVFALDGVEPKIAEDVWIAPGAVIVGDVEIGPGSSVWFQVVIRGDIAPIRLGANTNVQDGAVLHVDAGAPCVIGDGVTIGHRAIVHGATVGDGVTIGMGATVLSRASVGAGAIVAAQALVPEGAVVPPGTLAVGVPAREGRPLRDADVDRATNGARRYVENARRFREGLVQVGGVGTDGR